MLVDEPCSSPIRLAGTIRVRPRHQGAAATVRPWSRPTQIVRDVTNYVIVFKNCTPTNTQTISPASLRASRWRACGQWPPHMTPNDTACFNRRERTLSGEQDHR